MKKGFTLIELLAVIVILAIIALIATPIVLNIIDESKNNATLRSAEFYVKAAELSIAQSTLKDKNIQDGTYNLKDGDICLNTDCTDKLEVEVNGEVPKEGTITITNGNIYDLSIVLNDKTITKNSDGELVYQEGSGSVNEVIKLCIANTTKATALVWKNGDVSKEYSYAREEVGLIASESGAYTPGVAYTCNFIDDSESNNMIFFILSSTENDVTLIAGSNLGGTVAWSEDEDNHRYETEDKQAVTAKAALADRTSNWNKLDDTQKATIKLPTVHQIVESAGQIFNNSSIDAGGLPTWLCSHATSPVYNGYWTSSPDVVSGISKLAWYVYGHGEVDYQYIPLSSSSYFGIRPVITISKSNIG